ncbi:hypothetical protein J7T55_011004 [Diaporthe amygdali]|uniref:uncharacterized protein n=1 Tax=Phomopsis amygdali TaxID=1214568 RepID=UPI0022FEABD9|nr:uncharacterized protein J7T55_011004 [Diaporthe amygdali]KAJ0103987.1 hypothetical protein J7T55_011004 [Diaporthe amygdali]
MSYTYGAETTAEELVSRLGDQIKGKVILTTGVSPGSLGAVFLDSIASAKPGLLILASRNLSKVQKTADALASTHPSVQTRPLQLDLGSFAAVRESAAVVNGWDDVPKIDVLVNNAGIMGVDFTLTPDGHESTFATNHLGPFLFTNLIMGKLLAAEKPRVINISSDGHRLNPIRWGDYNFHNGETYNKWFAYGQSKTANMLMAISLAQKLGPKLLAFSLHPGTIMTNLTTHLVSEDGWLEVVRASDKVLGNSDGWKDYSWKTEQQGAATHVFASFDTSISENNGAYLDDCHVADPWTQTVRPWGTSPIEAERLWKLSEQLVGQSFDY